MSRINPDRNKGAEAIPADFIDYLRHDVATAPLADILAESLDRSDPVCAIRLNRAKPADLTPLTDGASAVPWCPSGLILPDGERPRFTFDPLLHQGAYYVQDPSSMAVGAVVAYLADRLRADNREPLRVLDACAAPGGKSTHAASVLPRGTLLVANEFVARRADILHENLAKFGSADTLTCSTDTSLFAGIGPAFDLILADVPCSGEGMMRKDPAARAQWSRSLVEECSALQRRIVTNLWGALRPGGYMIYSTCTFNATENDHNVARFVENLGAEPVSLRPLADSWGDCGVICHDGMLRFVPGAVRGEGQFIALLRKPLIDTLPNGSSRRQRVATATAAETALWRGMLLDPDRMTIAPPDKEGLFTAWPASAASLPPQLHKICRPVLRLGNLKKGGNRPIPAQELALSQNLNPEAFDRCPVNRDTALLYLRRQAITLPDSTPKGIILLTYNELPLGFVNNLGNRANNLYPAPWRILSQG